MLYYFKRPKIHDAVYMAGQIKVREENAMKHNSIKALILLLCVAAFLSSCGLPSAGTGGVATIKPAELPTTAPTAASANTSQYFQEDFNGDLSSWSQFVVNGAKVAKGGNATLANGPFGQMTVSVTDGFLLFDLESAGQWVYTTYDPQLYTDVKIEVSAENRGVNNNNVSLICRYDPSEGWYEFNIANSGLYDVYYATVKSDKTVAYTRLLNGGYNKIKSGKDTNEYGFTCQGKTLTMTINGHDVNTYDDNAYGLKKGKIGVSVSSFDLLPAKVGFDWIKVSQP
jgi:hypothetical protein